jgi:quinol monooxygenase YgiN
MLVVTTIFEVEADSLDVFRAAMSRQAEITRTREIGCHRYDISFDPKIATRCLTYSIFEDEAAYEHHLATDHFRTFDDLIFERVMSSRTELWQLAVTARRTGIREAQA